MTVETQSLEDALKLIILLELNIFDSLLSTCKGNTVFRGTVSVEVLQGIIICWCQSL